MNSHLNNLPPQEQNGIAQARFQGFTDSVIKGNDRHVAIELRSLAGVKSRTKIHTIDIMGVGERVIMFTEQSGNLKQAFIQAGISPLAAEAVTHALANCAQSLEHRGPFKVQYVPQDSRLVEPDFRRRTTQQALGDYIPSDGERRPFVPPEEDPPDESCHQMKEPRPFDPTDIYDALNGAFDRIQDRVRAACV